MMTTVTRPAPPARQLSAPWLRVYRWTLGMMVYLSMWFWAIVVGGAVLVMFTVSRWVTPEMSAMQFAHHGGLWFPFSISVILSATLLPLSVANGITRRAYIQGAVATAVTTGVGFGVLMSISLVIERWIYARLGWFPGASNDSTVQALAGPFGSYAAGLVALYVAGTLSGLLVGIAYYRGGGWWGTLALPLTLSPIAVVGLLGIYQPTQWTPWDVVLVDLGAIRPLLAVAALVLAVVAFHLLTRRVPIHPKEA